MIVKPTTAKYRIITEKDINGNPIIFGIVCAVWVCLNCLDRHFAKGVGSDLIKYFFRTISSTFPFGHAIWGWAVKTEFISAFVGYTQPFTGPTDPGL